MTALTLVERIETSQSAPGAGTVRFISGDAVEAVRWGRILDDATVAAARLQDLGAGPGAKVALLGTTSRAMVTAIEAVWLAGATVVVLPLPMRLASIEAFVHQTRMRLAGADAMLLVVEGAIADIVDPAPTDPPRVRARGPHRARPRPLAGRDGRSRRPRHPAVHERVDGRPQGRDAPAPPDLPQPRQHRDAEPASAPTTSSSRGSRSITTWV